MPKVLPAVGEQLPARVEAVSVKPLREPDPNVLKALDFAMKSQKLCSSGLQFSPENRTRLREAAAHLDAAVEILAIVGGLELQRIPQARPTDGPFEQQE